MSRRRGGCARDEADVLAKDLLHRGNSFLSSVPIIHQGEAEACVLLHMLSINHFAGLLLTQPKSLPPQLPSAGDKGVFSTTWLTANDG